MKVKFSCSYNIAPNLFRSLEDAKQWAVMLAFREKDLVRIKKREAELYLNDLMTPEWCDWFKKEKEKLKKEIAKSKAAVEYIERFYPSQIVKTTLHQHVR